jgi:hypothetical protein
VAIFGFYPLDFELSLTFGFWYSALLKVLRLSFDFAAYLGFDA